MIDPAFGILAGLTIDAIKDAFITWMFNNKDSHDKQTKDAIEAFRKAFLKTDDYLHKHVGDAEELRDLWYKAELELRSINPNLARQCFKKGDYWTHAYHGTEEQLPPNFLEEYRISFKEMREKFEKI